MRQRLRAAWGRAARAVARGSVAACGAVAWGRAACATTLALAAAAQTGGGVTARMEFACLWWSEAQMNGLNPNAPPPKTTEVRIKQWEYSDPVGAPHPDAVDAVVTLAGGEAFAGMEVEFTTQWKIGRYGKPGTAVWGPVKPARGMPAAREVRLRVDLKAMMDALDRQNKWPFGVRVRAVVKRAGAAEAVTRVTGELPIRQGD